LKLALDCDLHVHQRLRINTELIDVVGNRPIWAERFDGSTEDVNVLAVQSSIAVAFILFILVTSNPFLRIPEAPLEGRDLNPMLQDPGLAIHQ
jgi:cytochrome c biogenesis factor